MSNDQSVSTASTTSPREIVGQFYRNFNNGLGALDANFDDHVALDVVNHVLGGTFPFEEWKAGDRSLLGGMTDFYFTVLDQVVEGDKVATRWELGGTHTGEVHGVAASGRKITLTGTQVDLVEGGMIVERWGDFDYTGFLRDLRAEQAA